MSTFTLQSFFKIFTWSSLVHSFVNGTFKLKPIWPECFSSIKAVFAIIQDQMQEVIEARSRFVLDKLAMQVSVVTETGILLTHASSHGARCLVRLFFATFFFYPFAHWNKVFT